MILKIFGILFLVIILLGVAVYFFATDSQKTLLLDSFEDICERTNTINIFITDDYIEKEEDEITKQELLKLKSLGTISKTSEEDIENMELLEELHENKKIKYVGCVVVGV